MNGSMGRGMSGWSQEMEPLWGRAKAGRTRTGSVRGAAAPRTGAKRPLHTDSQGHAAVTGKQGRQLVWPREEVPFGPRPVSPSPLDPRN